MASPVLRDADWVRQAFLVASADLTGDKGDVALREFSTVELKFTDTTPGGNTCINPPPQFTRFCDLRQGTGLAMNMRRGEGGVAKGSHGMGLYYSEAIDDNKQLIHMRFGVPSYNSLATFFTGFYNSGAASLARTGRSPGWMYSIGKVVGFVVPLLSFKLLAIMLLGRGIKFALNKPASRFYNLKPTMPVYWNCVQNIVNHICVNAGIVPRAFAGDAKKLDDGYVFGPDAAKKMHAILPDIFNESGSIDVFAMANRGQRLARKEAKWWQDTFSDSNLSLAQIGEKVRQAYDAKISDDKKRSYQQYQDQWIASAPSMIKEAAATFASVSEADDKSKEGNTGFFEFLEAELDDGAAFASFRVNATGTVSESFSNSVGESEIQSKFNSMSSQGRNTRFNFAEGNLFPLQGLAASALASGMDFVKGVTDGLGLSGIAALGGSAFVDIPQHWQSSSSQLPRSSYSIDLICPYNNPISRLINIYVPMAMLLAAALPMSTGKQSYTSPFIVELYDRGRSVTRIGMIDSLSFSRGEGNVGWDKDGHFLNVKANFSIVDMSSVLHMPVIEGFGFGGARDAASTGAVVGGVLGLFGGPAGAILGTAAGGVLGTGLGALTDTASAAVDSLSGLFDDENVFTDYMSTLSSVGLADMIYPFRRFKRNLTMLQTKWDSFLSPANFASYMGDTLPAHFVSLFYKGTIR